MKEIKLFNRDGADLKLVQKHLKEIEPHITEWELKVDENHSYVLKFCRFIGEHQIENNKVNWDVIEAIDPSGGPMLSIGDEFEGKYKIVKINSVNNIWISEGNNN
jgi:hypothetical protein